MSDRIPPQDPAAETALLGTLLFRGARAVEAVRPILGLRAFYRQDHQMVYDAVLELFDKNKPIDLTTVANAIEAKGYLEEVGGASVLAGWIESASLHDSGQEYARIVAEMAQRRSLIRVGTEVIEAGFDLDGDTAEAIAATQRRLFEMEQREQEVDPATLSAILTGLYDLDEILGGFFPGQLIVLAARPGIGKTAFALYLAKNLVARGVPVFVQSCEMTSDELAMRFYSMVGEVDGRRMKAGTLTDDDWGRIMRAMAETEAWPLYIDDSAGATVADIARKSRKLMADLKKRLGLVVVDYLQLLRRPTIGKQPLKLHERIGADTKDLKQLAKEIPCPVLALAQLNRVTDLNKDRKPVLANLKDSGDIEQDADVVLFLHRDEKMPDSCIELVIPKQRSGPQGSIYLQNVRSQTAFRSLLHPDHFTGEICNG